MDNLKEKSLNVGCNRFADFREKINNICNYAEFKKVGIFEIYLSVTKKCVFFGFNFENYTVKKAHFMLYSNPLKYLRYILPFKSYECKFLFLFFNSAIPLCEVFLGKNTTFTCWKCCKMGSSEDTQLLFFAGESWDIHSKLYS